MTLMAEFINPRSASPLQAPPKPQEPEIPPRYRPQEFPAPPPKRKSSKWLIILLVILAFGGVAAVAWQEYSNRDAQTAPEVVLDQPLEKEESEDESPKDIPDAPGTKTYENGFLGVEFSYPETWTAMEGVNGESVRITSPEFAYTTIDNSQVQGMFKIYVRKGARSIDGKYIGRGYAIEKSETLRYENPTASQRPDTYLSLFGLDEPTNFAYFFIAGNFELEKGDTLGPTYGQEPDTYIIAGGYSQADHTDDLQTNLMSPAYVKGSNAYKQARSILQSMRLR